MPRLTSCPVVGRLKPRSANPSQFQLDIVHVRADGADDERQLSGGDAELTAPRLDLVGILHVDAGMVGRAAIGIAGQAVLLEETPLQSRGPEAL